MNELTIAQQVFAVFYAIFFGTMLQTVGARRSLPDKEEYKKIKVKNPSLNLFDTPNAWAIGCNKNNKPFWRFIISSICLNILPGVIFALIFFGLHGLSDKSLQSEQLWQKITQLTVIVWISLTPQYIYRLFYSVLTISPKSFYLTKNTKKEHKGYNDYDIAAYWLLWEDRLQFESHKDPVNHLAFPIFFFLPSTLLLYKYFLVSSQVNDFYVGVSIALFLSGIGGFFINRFHN